MKTRIASCLALAIVASSLLIADHHNTYPLPEERGAVGMYQALLKLPIQLRVLYITAHPDDENGGMLTFLARRMHARTALFSLTRGDGGQNILGGEKYEALGLVRTGELLEACRLYGAELYFSTAYEFGFSKTAGETLAKWGREASLGEVVRFIRRYRPDIVFSAFRGSGGDGHGHHQVAGILAHEAFLAAGDPGRFPEHFQDGLLPWQAKKLYESAGRGAPPGDNIATFPTGEYDPILGRSAREIGAEGYSKHRTQGNGAGAAIPLRSSDSFRLVTAKTAGGNADAGLLINVDTSLASILELAGAEREKVPFLPGGLSAAQKAAEDAIGAFRPDRPADCAPEIARGVAILRESIGKTKDSPLSTAVKNRVLDALEQKHGEFQKALEAVLGLYLLAAGSDPTAAQGENVFATVSLFNRGPSPIEIVGAKLLGPSGLSMVLENEAPLNRLANGGLAMFRGGIDLPAEAPVTQPHWFREGTDDNRYRTRPTPDFFSPFDPPALSAEVAYRFRGIELAITAPLRVQAGTQKRGSDFVDLQIVPPLSVQLQPELGIVPAGSAAQTRELRATMRCNKKNGASGSVKLIPPAGWQVDPDQVDFSIAAKGESFTARFKLRSPSPLPAGQYQIEAVASLKEGEYRRGYRVISYPENWTRNLYTPAKSTIRAIDLAIAPGLKIGYVPGSGDEVPEALEKMGASVEMLGESGLSSGDLSRFGAIVTGIRAYNVNEDLRAHNRRLLEYVERGGTLIVQYCRSLGRGSGGGIQDFPFGPYPMTISEDRRITVEESPVEILEPAHPLLNSPNKISAADFGGWVQERGLNFMNSWDARYTPVLSGHDPGEPPLKGGMLVVRFGKGYYVYTAYAWFRQLPAGVPGAYRIFANMLSLGK